MLLRTAKAVGFLRVLIPQIAPLVANNAGLLSVRFVAYLVGFAFSSILSLWFPILIVATLVSVTGAFNSASSNSQCQAYRAEMARIEAVNTQRMAAYRLTYSSWYKNTYEPWYEQYTKYMISSTAANPCLDVINPPCSIRQGSCFSPRQDCERAYDIKVQASAPVRPTPPPYPQLLSYSPPSSGCGSTNPSINCPAGKKVWLQVLWGSPGGKASDSKGCFLVAYSQQLYNLPVKIEYNPFLPVPFVTSRAASYYLVKGDRFRGLSTTVWKDLESVQGWDKGYWIAEIVDPECRGWRPGWSRKIK